MFPGNRTHNLLRWKRNALPLSHRNTVVFTLSLNWPPQSPDLNPIEHLWDVVEREIRIMDVQPTNLQQLCDAIMSMWTKTSEECFQHLVESMPRRIKAALKAKRGPTRYKQGVPIPCVCVCTYIFATETNNKYIIFSSYLLFCSWDTH